MLVPKGTKSGFAADLFVMISDWESDEVSYFFNLCNKDAFSR